MPMPMLCAAIADSANVFCMRIPTLTNSFGGYGEERVVVKERSLDGDDEVSTCACALRLRRACVD